MMLRSFRGDFAGAEQCIESVYAAFPAGVTTAGIAGTGLLALFATVLRDDPRRAREKLAEAMKRQARFRLMHSFDAGVYAAVAALVEARALKSGDPEASIRNVRRYSVIAAEAPPLGTTRAQRALAYAREASVGHEATLRALLDAEHEAARFGQAFDVAIAQFQRGKRLGGVEGASLRANARASFARIGAGEAWLTEDEI
jgi:hypothetical protein